MTYSEFLDSLVSPISYFVSWLGMVANSLLHNYFFITILGIVLFISLVWLIYDIIDFFLYSHINDYDDYENKYYDYSLYREVKDNYEKKHNSNVDSSSNSSSNLLYASNVSSPLQYSFRSYDSLYYGSRYYYLNGNNLINKQTGNVIPRFIKDPSGKYSYIDLLNNVYVDENYVFQNWGDNTNLIIDKQTGNIVPRFIKDPSGKYPYIDLLNNVYVDENFTFANFKE